MRQPYTPPEKFVIYGRSLMKMLRWLGFNHKAIAQQLGISNTLVSLWARGHRPVAHRYLVPLQELGRQAFQAQYRAYETTDPGRAEAFRQEWIAYEEAWMLEYAQDHLYERLSRELGGLRPYTTMSPDKLRMAVQGGESLTLEQELEAAMDTLRLIKRVPTPADVERLQDEVRDGDLSI